MAQGSRSKKAGKWSDGRTQQPITVLNERTGFLPVLKMNFNKYNKIEKNNDFLSWEEVNRIINTLLNGWLANIYLFYIPKRG